MPRRYIAMCRVDAPPWPSLADSLAANGGLDEADLMCRFVRWHEHGEYSCTDTRFDIGITARHALSHWEAKR